MLFSELFPKKMRSYGFKQSFYQITNFYLREAEALFSEYGESPPYVSKSDYSIEFEDSSYQQLTELGNLLNDRLQKIKKLEDIERTDLEKLIQLVKIVYNFKGKEEILLRYSVCPKCGDKIKETQEYIGGGTENNPEPTGVYYRVGCQKCDYLLHDETFDI